jgi:hypothetical protein
MHVSCARCVTAARARSEPQEQEPHLGLHTQVCVDECILRLPNSSEPLWCVLCSQSAHGLEPCAGTAHQRQREAHERFVSSSQPSSRSCDLPGRLSQLLTLCFCRCLAVYSAVVTDEHKRQLSVNIETMFLDVRLLACTPLAGDSTFSMFYQLIMIFSLAGLCALGGLRFLLAL